MATDIKFTKLEEIHVIKKNTLSILPYITPVATGITEIIYGLIYLRSFITTCNINIPIWLIVDGIIIIIGACLVAKNIKLLSMAVMALLVCSSIAGVISIWGVCSKSQVSPSSVWVFAAAVVIPRPFILAGIAIFK